jgi:hypothetical protein
MTALLDGAVRLARENGARVIEAYPIDTDAAEASSNELYRGTLGSFVEAGFAETARPRADRTIVSLNLR